MAGWAATSALMINSLIAILKRNKKDTICHFKTENCSLLDLDSKHSFQLTWNFTRDGARLGLVLVQTRLKILKIFEISANIWILECNSSTEKMTRASEVWRSRSDPFGLSPKADPQSTLCSGPGLSQPQGWAARSPRRAPWKPTLDTTEGFLSPLLPPHPATPLQMWKVSDKTLQA